MSATLTLEARFRARRRARNLASLIAAAIVLAALIVSARVSEAYPDMLAAGLPRVGDYFHRLLPVLHADTLFDGVKTEGSIAYWFYRLGSWSWLLFETSQMALLATVLGGALGFLLSFSAASNIAPGRGVFFVCRRFLELFRTVPDIVYALILVYAFGVGPLAGILAIALHTVGALGKQFAEVIENADMKPWDGVRASGGNWAQGVRYAILPQVLPNFVSYVLLRFEINVRSSTVIGFVGAGGIGQELYQVISFNIYEEVSAIVVLVIFVVAVIDQISELIRTWAIGREAI